MLKEKLLSLGGNQVKLGLDTEEEKQRMLNDGKIFNLPIEKLRGQPNQCHRNVAERYENSKKHGFKIVSGYALAEDGVWYSHSWGLSKGGTIILETTQKFQKYFGYILNESESEEFCFENY